MTTERPMLPFTFHGAHLCAMSSGALHWPDRRMLVVSDLHFGKALRPVRWGGPMLPPYEVRDTLTRLEADIEATRAQQVICLGDSFDSPGVDLVLPTEERVWITQLQNRVTDWIWIEGNHDPGPVSFGGRHMTEYQADALVFRHIATADQNEVSGHYHPKARLRARGRSLSRPCFLVDQNRIIMPAYGAFTGGLFSHDPVLADLMTPKAQAILTGMTPPRAIPMPRGVGAFERSSTGRARNNQ